MRAYRLLDWGRPPELVEVPEPEVPPGGALVRIAGCGLCHSDLTMMSMPGEVGDALGWRVPFTLGHEPAGWVEALGPEVDGPEVDPSTGAGSLAAGGRLAVGDAVVVVSPTICGECDECRRGNDRGCQRGLVGRGYGRDGGLAELLAVERIADLVPLGGFDPRGAGPLADAGATSYHAVDRVVGVLDPKRAGRRAVAIVIGVGGLGSFCVQLLRLRSDALVVAVEPDEARRAKAAELGANVVLDRLDGSAVAELTGGLGADAVLDVVGSDSTISAGIRSLRSEGAFVLVGSEGGTLSGPWFDRLPRGATISRIQGSGRRDLQGVAELAAGGRLRVDVEQFPLAEVAEAYRRLEAGTLTARAVVTP